MGEFYPCYVSPLIVNDKVKGSKWDTFDIPLREICRNDL